MYGLQMRLILWICLIYTFAGEEYLEEGALDELIMTPGERITALSKAIASIDNVLEELKKQTQKLPQEVTKAVEAFIEKSIQAFKFLETTISAPRFSIR